GRSGGRGGDPRRRAAHPDGDGGRRERGPGPGELHCPAGRPAGRRGGLAGGGGERRSRRGRRHGGTPRRRPGRQAGQVIARRWTRARASTSTCTALIRASASFAWIHELLPILEPRAPRWRAKWPLSLSAVSFYVH